MIWVNQNGEEKKFSGTCQALERVANMFIKNCGISKGDRVLIMLPRVPEWWIFTLAMIKRGVVYCPAPTMLTQDLKYRIQIADIKMVITAWSTPQGGFDLQRMPVPLWQDGDRRCKGRLDQHRPSRLSGTRIHETDFPSWYEKDPGHRPARDIFHIRNNR